MPRPRPKFLSEYLSSFSDIALFFSRDFSEPALEFLQEAA
jgi:hypothetical protein